MSLASLDSWLKAVTTLNPLQFHKRLRLQEARRLLYRKASASIASQKVGYQAPRTSTATTTASSARTRIGTENARAASREG